MEKTWLEAQLRDFDPGLPIEEAWLPPSSWYTSRAVYEIERATVFRNNWLIAAREDQLRQSGDYVAGTIAHEPYVVVREKKDRLGAFFNVCRHHAAQVAIGAGNTESLVCPYHGWTYGLDGRLLRAPELGGVRDFDRACFGLTPMQVARWGPFVFLAMDRQSRSIATDLAELDQRLAAMDTDRLVFIARRSYLIKCNWKVYVDNYLDGGYHVSYLHRGLAGQLDLDSYRTEIFERYSIQSGAGARDAAPDSEGKDFAERVGNKVLYAWIYPNLMINRYGPFMDTNWVLPRGHSETEVVFDYYLLDSMAGDEAFIARSLDASDVVQQEDIDICESVQRGLGSTSYNKGRYSVKREMGEYHFHRLLAADLATRDA